MKVKQLKIVLNIFGRATASGKPPKVLREPVLNCELQNFPSSDCVADVIGGNPIMMHLMC